MIVVSDTSPLSNLFIIGRLELLHQLFEKIVVPTAVMNELLELEKRGIDLSLIKNAPWIDVVEVKHIDSIQKLLIDLDRGEAEAIVLAESMHADWLLIDETKGRNIAKLHGLRIVGLLGILLLAKEKGLISSVKPLITELISKAKFRIDDGLYHKIISLAQE